MSRYRNVHTKMWKSADFLALSPLKPSGQALFLYLLTGTHTTAVPGILVAGPAAIAEELGWKDSDVRKYLAEIVKQGMAVVDSKTRLIYMPAGLAHNRPANPNIVRSWRDEWAMVPACPLRDRIDADFGRILASFGEQYTNAWANVSRNVPSNVPGGFEPERSVERSVDASAERSPDGSSERSGEGSLRTRTRACAAPAPDTALSSGGGAGGVPAEGQFSAAWVNALAMGGAGVGLGAPRFDEDHEQLRAFWLVAQSKGLDWSGFCADLAAGVAEWVKSKPDPKVRRRGWRPVDYREHVASKGPASEPRSPATALYVPPDTSDAVPPPKAFQDALRAIGGPTPSRGSA